MALFGFSPLLLLLLLLVLVLVSSMVARPSSMVTLVHGANTVTVPVLDRGPYIAGREFDPSPRVKAALDCTECARY